MPALLGSCVSQKTTPEQELALNSMAKRGDTPEAQTKFMRDQHTTVVAGVVTGRVLGAAAVYALGNRLGPLGQIAVYLGGAAVGGLVGDQIISQPVARKKALAQASEANLDAAIKESITENAKARRQVAALRTELISYKNRVTAAQAKGDAKEFAKIKDGLLTLNKNVAAQVREYDSGIGMQKQIIAKVSPANAKQPKLSSTLKESIESRNTLETERKLVVSLMNSLPAQSS
ncbi:MAG: hypothetical protein ACKVY0_23030 [Prosthecobacter sp.]|uniref:hypothetical protein n=1 Tax=Prosthecobacter sp. TaxID=1965333 RepID=UPI003903DBF0